MGPLISERQFKRVLGYISSGVREGAEIITGGGRHGDGGFYVQPTLFTKPAAGAKIVQEEIFGPVWWRKPSRTSMRPWSSLTVQTMARCQLLVHQSCLHSTCG